MANKSDSLRSKATVFLARPIPDELKPKYAPGSLADMVIGACAAGEEPDPEILEIAEMACGEYDSAIADAKTAELKKYYSDCQALLSEINAAA